MTIPGAVTITRVQSNGTTISLSIQDRLSARTFVEVTMSLEAFAMAVTGISHQPGEMRIQDLSLVGKQLEIKSEVIPQVGFNATRDEILEALAPFEVDGWVGVVNDVTNHHRFVGNDKVSVGFKRYVPATEADIEEARKKNE